MKGVWARWRAMVREAAQSGRLTVMGTHWVVYKALLSDLIWEGVLTEAEANERRAKLEAIREARKAEFERAGWERLAGALDME